MKSKIIITLLISIIAISAHGKDRKGQWEATLMAKHQGEDTVVSKNGSRSEFDDNTGWGFSLGYNLDNHWNFAWEFAHTNPKYKAEYTDSNGKPQTLSHRSDFYTNNLNVTFHLLEGNITPYAVLGGGFAYVDSNVSNGQIYCSGYYYWYCYSNSFNTTEWTYNAALGLRADITKTAFLRGSYGYQKIDMGSGSNKSDATVTRFEAGLRF